MKKLLVILSALVLSNCRFGPLRDIEKECVEKIEISNSSRKEIIKAVKRYKETSKELFDRADRDGSGGLNAEEFHLLRIATGTQHKTFTWEDYMKGKTYYFTQEEIDRGNLFYEIHF